MDHLLTKLGYHYIFNGSYVDTRAWMYPPDSYYQGIIFMKSGLITPRPGLTNLPGQIIVYE